MWIRGAKVWYLFETSLAGRVSLLGVYRKLDSAMAEGLQHPVGPWEHVGHGWYAAPPMRGYSYGLIIEPSKVMK